MLEGKGFDPRRKAPMCSMVVEAIKVGLFAEKINLVLGSAERQHNIALHTNTQGPILL